jgi:acetylornithine deacetylase
VSTAAQVSGYLDRRRDEMLATLDALLRVPSLPGTVRQNECLEIVRGRLAADAEVDAWTPDWSAVEALEAPIGRRLFVPVAEERGEEHAAAIESVGCLVASVGSGHPHLIINGHIDVVPADPAGWSSDDPFAPVELDGRIVARGSMDMKAGVVAALYAFNAVTELGLLDSGRLSLAIVPEEESGGNGTLACLERGHVGDGVVFAEPTGLDVVHRHVGIQSFVLTAEGEEGGMLRQGSGASAIAAIAHATVALEAVAGRRLARALAAGGYDRRDDPAFVNVGLISGGEWAATKARQAQARGLFGMLPGESLEAAEGELREAVAAATAALPAAVEIGFGKGGHPGGELAADHPLVTALQGAGGDLGTEFAASRAGAMVCDAKIVHGGGWAPAVVFGPSGAGLHAADEYVEIDSIERCAAGLALAARRYCEGSVASGEAR